MKRALLLAALLGALIPVACRGTGDEAPGPAGRRPVRAASLDDSALSNGFYCSSDIVTEGPVRLANGSWSAEDEEGRQSLEIGKPRARGDLDGDGREDAVIILLGSGGGSGVFVDVAVVLDQNGVPVHAASAALGDRVQVNGLSIEGSDVIVDLTQHGPGDPACCPTQNVKRRFRFDGSRLVDTAAPQGAPPPDGSAPPAGSTASH
jgi:hypothetical protein